MQRRTKVVHSMNLFHRSRSVVEKHKAHIPPGKKNILESLDSFSFCKGFSRDRHYFYSSDTQHRDISLHLCLCVPECICVQ